MICSVIKTQINPKLCFLRVFFFFFIPQINICSSILFIYIFWSTMNQQVKDNDDDDDGLSGRSQAVGVVLSLLLVVLTICMLVLLLYKQERRYTHTHTHCFSLFMNFSCWLSSVWFCFRGLFIQKLVSCCKRRNQVSYKYSKVVIILFVCLFHQCIIWVNKSQGDTDRNHVRSHTD